MLGDDRAAPQAGAFFEGRALEEEVHPSHLEVLQEDHVVHMAVGVHVRPAHRDLHRVPHGGHPAVLRCGTAPRPGSPTYGGPVSGGWDDGLPGVLALPSGRRVRGRAWQDLPPGPPPDLGIYLLGRAPPPSPWESQW